MEGKGRVCVTGAGGFIASWLVKLLLSKGYMVHGTAREPDDQKNAHLKKLKKAEENLQLFKANLLDYDSLCAAMAGCNGVFHVACPVPSGNVANPEIEVVEPAVTGTLNVLKACSEVGVKRVIFVSSIAAVMLNPNWPRDKAMDEDSWSDIAYCRASKDWLKWYYIAKTTSESEALKYSEENELNVVTVCPSLVLGPMLQPIMNTSSFVFTMFFKGHEKMENRVHIIADVRDVAEALLLVYEKQEASGRYICAPYPVSVSDLVEMLKTKFPNYNYPKNFIEIDQGMKLSSEKLKMLGWECRPLEDILADTVENFQEAGLLKKD